MQIVIDVYCVIGCEELRKEEIITLWELYYSYKRRKIKTALFNVGNPKSKLTTLYLKIGQFSGFLMFREKMETKKVYTIVMYL